MAGLAALATIFSKLGLLSWVKWAIAASVLFLWLDHYKVTPERNHELSDWLKSEPEKQFSFTDAVINVFDRIYTYPLLSWKTFRRSRNFTLIWILAYFIFAQAASYPQSLRYLVMMLSQPFWEVSLSSIEIIGGFIFSDYLSLFIIRGCFDKGRKHPILSFFLALLTGALVVLAGQFIFTQVLSFLIGIFIAHYDFDQAWRIFNWSVATFLRFIEMWWLGRPGGLLISISPAFLVHIWLPLFAIGALGVRLTYPLFAAVRWVLSWSGDEHPLDAIGMVAAIIVFMITVICRVV